MRNISCYNIIMNNQFEYWKNDYYIVQDIVGTEQEISESFLEIKQQFPNLMWGTHICCIEVSEGLLCAKVARFKTKELCLKHCTAPTLGWEAEGKVQI